MALDSIINQTLTSATASDIGKPKSNSTPFKQRFLVFAITGLVDSTIEIQDSVDNGVNFVRIESFTTDTSKAILHASPGVQYRFEVITYGSDTIKVILLN